jgi:hypothetical protein
MPVHKMRFVLVNDMTQRGTSVCTACSRLLEQGYLHDLSTSRRYCGIECYPEWMAMGEFAGSFAARCAGKACSISNWPPSPIGPVLREH